MGGVKREKKRKTWAAAALLAGAVLALCACTDGEKPQPSGHSGEGMEEMSENTEHRNDTPNAGESGGENEDWYGRMQKAAILSTGTNGRLEKALNKMKAGEKVTVAFLGGSITEGAGAADFSESYADLFAAGLKENYPEADISCVNAGLGGTGSDLGMMRYERDVTENAGAPDILILEFAVNDYQEPTGGRAYESLIRTVLKEENAPAVILLFSVFQTKWNLQEEYIPMGEWYGLPMVSIKDAIEQPYADGNLTDKEFFADEYHPTSYGHAIMADCLQELISQAESKQGGISLEAVPARSLTSADFTGMELVTAGNTEGVSVSPGSFSGTDTQVQAFGRSGRPAFGDNWMHTGENGNEVFRAEFTCRNILLSYKTFSSEEYGRALVYVDGELAAELNGYSRGGWNNSNTALVLDGTENGSHVLEIRMAEGDENKKFTLLGIGISRYEAEGLAKVYEDNFPIGIALPNLVLKKPDAYEEVICSNFNSITCENEMKPDALLDRGASINMLKETDTHAAVRFGNCQPAIDFALKHGMKLRLHTLVWHSQTPKWFFTEDYTENGKLADRETMLARMENYIADVLGYFRENYPGLVYAVDVANEAFDKGNGDENGVRRKDNLWYETVGADYYYYAFVFARKYASEDMKLFYNDYGCMDKVDLILGHLEQAREEGLIDGIGMQSHLSTDDKIQYKFMLAVKQFCDAGYEVQATELDIGVKSSDEEAYAVQARKYRSFFKNMKQLQEEGYPITGITVWGLSDAFSWRPGEDALLFDKDMNPKKAYYGAMLDPSVPDVE